MMKDNMNISSTAIANFICVISESMFLKYLGSIVENDSGKSTPLSDDMVPTSRHMEFSTNAELNLSCCILMLDILLKQVRWKFRVNVTSCVLALLKIF